MHHTLYKIKNNQIIVLLQNFPIPSVFLDENTPVYTFSNITNALVLLHLKNSGHSRILVKLQWFDEMSMCNQNSSDNQETNKYKEHKSMTLKFTRTRYIEKINQILSIYDEF